MNIGEDKASRILRDTALIEYKQMDHYSLFEQLLEFRNIRYKERQINKEAKGSADFYISVIHEEIERRINEADEIGLTFIAEASLKVMGENLAIKKIITPSPTLPRFLYWLIPFFEMLKRKTPR